jgi:glycosyltransferase involved in cell wall biosynthesis
VTEINSMNLPNVSVIFLCYNQEKYVKDSLLGALRQDLPSYELIIADDASSDSTMSVVRSVLAENSRQGVSIKVINQEKNQGLVGNFNSALAAASGDVFVMMAGDDISHPERARLMAEAFAHNPKVRAINCARCYIDAEGMPISSRPPSLVTRTFEYGGWRKNLYAGAPVTGALAAYHRSILDVFGPLPADAGAEDADSVFRALILGSVMYYGAVLVDYRMHVTNMSNFDLRERTDDELIMREVRWASDVAKKSSRWMSDLQVGEKAGHVDQQRFTHIASLVRRSICRHELTALSLGNAPRSLWVPSAWRLIKCGGIVKTASLFFMWVFDWRKYAHIRRVRRQKF